MPAELAEEHQDRSCPKPPFAELGEGSKREVPQMPTEADLGRDPSSSSVPPAPSTDMLRLVTAGRSGIISWAMESGSVA